MAGLGASTGGGSLSVIDDSHRGRHGAEQEGNGKRLPGTLKRSPDNAQDTYMHTLQSAEQVYGDGEAPHRIALALLETFLREGGRPLRAQGRAGPSDEQDAKRSVEAS